MSQATLRATVDVQTTGADDVKKLAQELRVLDKSLNRIHGNMKAFSNFSRNISTSMKTASRETDKFATAIAKADKNLDRFRQNMKGATGRTKNVTAGINEASFERAIKMTKELNGQLAQLANRLKLVPRSKSINVNAKYAETATQPKGKTSNLKKEKTSSFTDTGFVEGLGDVNFQKIRELQGVIQEFKNDVNKSLMPVQKTIENFGVKSQLSFEKAFQTPSSLKELKKQIDGANLAGKNVRFYNKEAVETQQRTLQGFADQLKKPFDTSGLFTNYNTGVNQMQETFARATDFMQNKAKNTPLNFAGFQAHERVSNYVNGQTKETMKQYGQMKNLYDSISQPLDWTKQFSFDLQTGTSAGLERLKQQERAISGAIRNTKSATLKPQYNAPSYVLEKGLSQMGANADFAQFEKLYNTFDNFGNSMKQDFSKPFIDMNTGVNKTFESVKRINDSYAVMGKTARNIPVEFGKAHSKINGYLKSYNEETMRQASVVRDLKEKLGKIQTNDFTKPFSFNPETGGQAQFELFQRQQQKLHQTMRQNGHGVFDITGAFDGKKIAKEFEMVQKALSGQASASQQIKDAFGSVSTTATDLNAKLGDTAKKVDTIGKKATEAKKKTNYLLHAVGTSLVLTAVFTIPQAFTEAIVASRQLEAQIQSLDRMFGEGATEMKRWSETTALSFGLSTQQAVDGASQFGNVVRTFAQNSQEMNSITLALMQQVSVVASQTGRTVDDVTKRFISGMLGGTEAIENLGIFVRQTALQATDAYKQIAGTQAWDTLTQAQQNQIYTLAILEQSYSRYGGSINPAMLATMQFTAQLQNLRTNIGNAFVPILNVVLPILNAFISWISTAMAYVSAFFSVLFGTSGGTGGTGAEASMAGMADAGSDFADATADSAGNLDDASKSAKEIKRSLAGFDEINLITQTGGDETNGGGGGGAPDLGGGGVQMPDFGQAGDYITEFQRKVQEAMDKVREFIRLVAPLGVVIATVFAFIGISVGNFAVAIGLAIGAIVLLFVDLWNTSDGFRDAVIGAWERISKLIEIVWVNVLEPFLTGFSEGFMLAYEIIKTVVDVVSQFVLGALSWLIDGLVWLLELFGITTEKGSWMATIFENLGVVIGVIAGFLTAYAVVVGVVATAIKVWTTITTIWTTVTTIASVAGKVFAGATLAISTPVLIIIAVIGALIAIGYLLIKNWDWISETAKNVWEFVSTWVVNKVEELKTSFNNFMDTVKTNWNNFWNGVKTIATNIVTATWNWISEKITWLVNLFTGIGGRIGDFFSWTMQTFKNGVSIAWNWVSGKVDSLVSWFTGVPSRIGNFFQSVVDGITGAISGAWSWVSDKVDDLVSLFKDIPDKIGSGIGGFFGGLFGRSFNMEFGVNGQLNTDGLPTNTPYLANGGLAFGKTTAVIGEYAGAKANPEVVAPLDKLTGILSEAITSTLGNGTGQGQDLYVNLEIDGTRFAKAVVKNVNDYTNATGRKVLKI